MRLAQHEQEVADTRFLTAGRTWAELKPVLYPEG